MKTKPYRYRQSRPLALTVEEREEVAGFASRAKGAGSLRIQIGRGSPMIIPKPLHGQILAVLRLAAEGRSASVDGLTPTLTTQQVAERLGVSRPHVVSLIESKQLAGFKVGAHRRVRPEDLAAYQAKDSSARSKALTGLVRQTRRLGLGY